MTVAVTAGAAVRAGSARLRTAGCDTPALDAELLVAAALGGVVTTAAVLTAVRVRRAAALEAARAQARAQLAQGVGVLAHELGAAALGPGASDADGADVAEASDTALDVRAVVGGSVVCSAGGGAGGGSEIDLAPEAGGVAWWAARRRAGAGARVHAPGASRGRADVAWRERGVVGAAAGAAVCGAGPFALPGAGVGSGWRLALGGPALPATVGAGAPVRVLRRRRYALYQGGDHRWYVGAREWDAGGPQGVQPLAGPFAPPAEGGMRVVVRDTGGAAVGLGGAGAAELEVRLLAVRQQLGVAWRDSAGMRVRPVGGGWAP